MPKLTDEELRDAFFPIRREETWKDLAADFPPCGIRNDIAYTRVADIGRLVAYDADGQVAGMLFYYFADIDGGERAGNVNLVVHKDKRRQGWGTKLMRQALQRWPIDFSKQLMTPEGHLLVSSLGGKRQV